MGAFVPTVPWECRLGRSAPRVLREDADAPRMYRLGAPQAEDTTQSVGTAFPRGAWERGIDVLDDPTQPILK